MKGIILFTLFNMATSLFAAPRITIDITNPNFRQFKLAIRNFKATGKASGRKSAGDLSKQMTKSLGKLLEITGLFKLTDKRIAIEKDPTKVDLSSWKSLKVDGLIVGSVTFEKGLMTTDIQFFDVLRGKRLIWKIYRKGKPSDLREICKRFANALMILLTGEPGNFKSKIVFLRKIGKFKQIYTLDVDGAGLTAITRNKSIHVSPSWSPDGTKISYTSWERGNPDLFVYSVITKRSWRVSGRSGLNTGATWTPDGGKLVFTRSRNGDSDIFLVNVDGTGFKSLVTGYGLDIAPHFSPDSKILAFVSGRSGSPHIWRMDMLSHKIEKLTLRGRYNADPSWSPDGKKIAFAGFDNGHFDIFMMDPDPIKPNFERLTINSGENEHPSFSPDGRQIVFQSNRDGQHELYIMNTDGSNQRRITYGICPCSSPEWSRHLGFR